MPPTIASKIPQRVSHFIVPAAILCFCCSQTVFILCRVSAYPVGSETRILEICACVKLRECLCFSNVAAVYDF